MVLPTGTLHLGTPPGAAPFDAALVERLAAAVLRREGPPRTRNLLADGQPMFTNRLALETSPYLLQHAHNPVDWRPWGEEAFTEAKARGVPVFLSIGYSTCHWCHVMEEESFEDPQLAQALNERWVCIKVDREERPDVDAVYMQAVQLLTGHGGWPMSVFLTHEKKPFFAGTYFPPGDGQRGARVGFLTVVTQLSRIFAEERPRAEESAQDLAEAVAKALRPEAPATLPGAAALAGALDHDLHVFDPREGGVRRAPKFPSSLNVRFLLRVHARTGAKEPLLMAWLTLEKMALGGLYDQVGGGFHRYSTDAQWLVPHFEKMLYDNALLAIAYTEAWQLFSGLPGAAPDGMAWSVKAAFCKRIALETLAYLDKEQSDPRGGFWSAADADSEGEEGTFFVWTPLQLAAALGHDDGAKLAALYGVTPEGNFEGKSVLSLAHVPQGEDLALLERARPKLYAARALRPWPLIDRKVLASWNGLAISAFARAGLAFAEPALVQRAGRAADELLSTHLQGSYLLRTSLAGVPRHPGLLEDHAFLAAGLLDLFEATGAPRWLTGARGLHRTLRARFADEAGGFFRTPEGHEALLAREKPAYDGAEPTGNSVAALNLLRLAALTGEDGYRSEAEALLRAFGATLAAAPAALGEALLALDFLHQEAREVVLLRPQGGSDAALLEVLRTRFAPAQVLVRAEEGPGLEALAAVTPLVRERTALAGATTAYLCRHGACGLPATTAEALRAQLATPPPTRR